MFGILAAGLLISGLLFGLENRKVNVSFLKQVALDIGIPFGPSRRELQPKDQEMELRDETETTLASLNQQELLETAAFWKSLKRNKRQREAPLTTLV